MLRSRLLSLFLSVLTAGTAAQLGAPFGDHAVLQSGRPVTVWGTGTPGERIRVTLGAAAADAVVSAAGRWEATLGPLEPSPVGTDLAAAGATRTVAHDVVVGEVWLLAGEDAFDAPAGSDAGFPASVRELRLGPGGAGQWVAAAPARAAAFSAVGGHFARELSARLGVPVGVVRATHAGARIDAWQQGPLGDAVVAALHGGVRGVLWDGGENEIGRATDYASAFPALIAAWRRASGQPELPFLWLQLGPRRPAPGFPAGLCPAMREAQARALVLPATGQALTIDLAGTRTPRDAQAEEARRLALLAKALVYDIPVDAQGPVARELSVEGASARVSFLHAGDGLTASGKPVQAIEVAGPDGVFHRASAVIREDAIVARAPEVAHPVAVRYAWADAPEANLRNGAGLPAAPFLLEKKP
jgi:sialate O-acetylesterase